MLIKDQKNQADPVVPVQVEIVHPADVRNEKNNSNPIFRSCHIIPFIFFQLS